MYCLTIWQLVATVIVGILTLVLTPWPSLEGGGFMVGAGPILIILLSPGLAVSAVSLVIVTFRRLKTKRLLAEMERLKTELALRGDRAEILPAHQGIASFLTHDYVSAIGGS